MLRRSLSGSAVNADDGQLSDLDSIAEAQSADAFLGVIGNLDIMAQRYVTLENRS